jgi:hypothetical protein
MSSELEGAAEAVTGAVLARAVEPTAGDGTGRGGPMCLNCGTPLTAAYCGACGQKGRVHRTLEALAHDVLHSVLHFDGKFWRTLPLLVWHPGQLTRRYVHGERAKFVSPLALFLFCVFLVYAVLNLGAVEAADVLAKEARIELGNERLNLLITDALKNPQLLFYKLQSNAYKFAWALVPISTPFVWLLFCLQREFKLFDHAVFVTYSLCFMLLLYTLTGVATRLPVLVSASDLALLVVPPLHMYRQVQHAYSLSRWSSVWRTVLLLTFACATLGVFGVLIVALGVSG